MVSRKKTSTTEKRRVFMVVVDNSEELHQALYFACMRAKSINGRVALMHCITPAEFQHWIGVGEIMENEAREEAEQLLKEQSELVHDLTGEYPTVHLREGSSPQQVIELINEEPDISVLVLGANTQGENVGPLVSYLTSRGMAQCRVPITVVPGNLSDEELDNLT